jgi:hypothetical protein
MIYHFLIRFYHLAKRRVHAKSNHSRICKSYTSSAPDPDDLATLKNSIYIGTPFSKDLCEQAIQV